MRSYRLVCVILLAATLFSLTASAQCATQWPNVASLPRGTEILVLTIGSQPCRLQSVDDDGLVCKAFGASIGIPRSSIRQVRLNRREKLNGLGAALGGAAGLAFGIGLTHGGGTGGDAGIIAWTTAIGAGFGALHGNSGPDHRIVYDCSSWYSRP